MKTFNSFLSLSFVTHNVWYRSKTSSDFDMRSLLARQTEKENVRQCNRVPGLWEIHTVLTSAEWHRKHSFHVAFSYALALLGACLVVMLVLLLLLSSSLSFYYCCCSVSAVLIQLVWIWVFFVFCVDSQRTSIVQYMEPLFRKESFSTWLLNVEPNIDSCYVMLC